MSKGVIDAKKDVQDLLQDLCARNTPAEIHYGPADDSHSARARLLVLQENVVCTDEPQNVESGVSLRTGDPIRVFLVKDGTRLGFDSRVQSLRCRIKLNADRSITGMALQIPASIRSEQRRRDFRVGLLGYKITCNLYPESKEHHGACDLTAKSMTCNLANISARGAGLIFHKSVRDLPKMGDMYFLDFSLPEEEGCFVALAEARHTKPVSGHDSVIVGMRIVPNEMLDERNTRNRLARFVVSEQRRMLRRRK